jgi:hypothetical protein
MIEQETLDTLHKYAVEGKSSDSWYPIGVLEWIDDIREYSEAGTPGDDWVWVKQEDRDQWSQEDNPEERKVIGKSKYYWISIGSNPQVGNTMYMLKPWTVVELLKWLVCSPVVAIGRTTDRGTPVMGIPRGVRLKGMTEWILREGTEEEKPTMRLIGALAKPWGLKDMVRCEVGHPVYEQDGQYLLMMDSTDGRVKDHRVTFNKQTLSPWIDLTTT